MLRKTPTFTIVAVLTLGLGIGANAAIFSVVNAVLLRPLPFHDPDRLMWIWATNERSGVRDDVASYPDFEDWRAQGASFESMAAFTWRDVGVSAGDHTELVPALQVTPGFFETLGVQAALGRVFGSGETEDAASHVVVLSDRMWKARFGGRGDVLGQTIRSNEASSVINETTARKFWPDMDPLHASIVLDDGRREVQLAVVGVVGDVRQTELWGQPAPEIYLNVMRPTPPWPWLSVVARTSVEPSTLARTVTLAVAAADPDVPISATKTLDEVRGESVAQPRVYTLLLGVFAGLALALAAVGLYGVMAYTVTQRIPEIGIRLALGADRRAVLGLVLKQAVFLVVVGVVVGLAATVPAAGVLTSLTPAARPTDPATLACVSVLLLTVALLASYLPARRASRVDPTVALKQE
jgi:MacB-like periplasmic core domain/FtsX-like permease family